MFCISLLISISSTPCKNSLGIAPSVLTTIGITISFMFHSFIISLAKSRKLSLFSLSFIFARWSDGTIKSTNQQVLFFFSWLSLSLVVWLRLEDPFLSQNHWEVCASHSPGWILGCAYTTYSYGQIKKFYAAPSGLPSSPSCVSSYTIFSLIYCICLLYDWLFCLYHHITDIYYFVLSIFSLT